jgi:hypothetical protein
MTLPPTASVVPEGIELGVREGLRARFRTPGASPGPKKYFLSGISIVNIAKHRRPPLGAPRR